MKPRESLAINVQEICWEAKGHPGAQGKEVDDCQSPGLFLHFDPGMCSEAYTKGIGREQERYCQRLRVC